MVDISRTDLNLVMGSLELARKTFFSIETRGVNDKQMPQEVVKLANSGRKGVVEAMERLHDILQKT